MRKKVLFIARFDNVLKGMNTILARTFDMQICPPEPGIVEKTLDVMEIDLVLLYISVLTEKLLYQICGKLVNISETVPIVAFGTAAECKEFSTYTPIPISKFMYRPLAAQDIMKVICELLEVEIEEEPQPQPEVKQSMSIADLAKTMEADQRRCVLLVDDDGRILRAIKMLLEKKYRVNLANSGISALASIERERPDAVLLDYEMPVMDGKQTLEMIRNNDNTRDLPVFYLTGVADKERIREVVHLKPQGYLLKSSEQSVIIGTLENFFKKQNQ